jgi:hypothetical protein
MGPKHLTTLSYSAAGQDGPTADLSRPGWTAPSPGKCLARKSLPTSLPGAPGPSTGGAAARNSVSGSGNYSIRGNWLYFATRSPNLLARAQESPVLSRLPRLRLVLGTPFLVPPASDR